MSDLQTFNDWFKQNWFTLVGILVIALIAAYDVSQVNAKIRQCGDDCNEHWMNQVERSCPGILAGGFNPQYNISMILGDEIK